MKITKNTFLWLVTVFLFMSFLVYFPSLSSIFMAIAVLLILPIKKWQSLLSCLFKKNSIKTILIVLLFIAGAATNGINETAENKPMTNESNNTIDKNDSNEKDEVSTIIPEQDQLADTKMPSENVETPSEKPESIVYHSNKTINKLLTAYNQVAETSYIISPEMVGSGAYSFNANISCNGVFIQIFTNDSGTFIDYQEETNDETAIKTLFGGFCKTLNPEITDNDIDISWNELKTEKYKLYNYYDIKGIKCTYTDNIVSNGKTSYLIKTQYDKYN